MKLIKYSKFIAVFILLMALIPVASHQVVNATSSYRITAGIHFDPDCRRRLIDDLYGARIGLIRVQRQPDGSYLERGVSYLNKSGYYFQYIDIPASYFNNGDYVSLIIEYPAKDPKKKVTIVPCYNSNVRKDIKRPENYPFGSIHLDFYGTAYKYKR